MERGKGGEGEKRERRWNGPDGGDNLPGSQSEGEQPPPSHSLYLNVFLLIWLFKRE